MPSNVKVTITGDSSGAEKAFQSASAAAKQMQDQLSATEDLMTQAGEAAMVGGALTAAGLSFAVSAAMKWESAFAGVKKTVDVAGLSATETAAAYATLEAGLRNMTRSLPATHQEIAAVAEAAGQLGVKRGDVVAFTKVMVDLGETTNLTSDEAASALARLMNIMGTSTRDVSRLGSAIVALGNDGASTEAEIVEMGLRIAGAGKQIGLSETEVLGFANALSSVGIEAEAGGTAMSTAFVKIDKAVRTGGDTLTGFAQVAGMTSEEFARAYRDDAAGAIATFVEGLGQISATGGDTFGTLDNLGLTGVRLQDALLRSSAAGDMLRASLQTGNDAWSENTALLAEAEKRYETTEAKVQIARNAIADAGITIGTQLLPVLGELAADVATVADWFGSLPEPVQRAGARLAVAATAAGLFGGAALVLIPRIQALTANLIAAGGAAAFAGRGLQTLTRYAGPIGLALTALSAIGTVALSGWIDQKQAVDDYASSLDAANAATTEATRVLAAKRLQDEGALEKAEMLGLSLSTITDATLGNVDALEQVRAAQEALNSTTLTNQEINEGGLSVLYERREAAEELLTTIDQESTSIKGAQEAQVELNAAAAESGGVTRDAAQAQEMMGQAVEAMGAEAEEAEAALQTMRETLQSLLVDTFSVEAATDAFESSLIDLTEQVAAATEAEDGNARSLDGNSAAALANRESLRGLVEASGKVIEKMIEQGATSEDVAAETQRLKGRIDEVGAAAGLSAEDVAGYSARLDDVPDAVSTTVSTVGLASGISQLDEYTQKLVAFDGNVYTTTIRTIRQDGGVSVFRGPDMRARGGPIKRGQPYIVGEEGPELIVAPEDGYVLDARQSAAVIGKGYEVPAPVATTYIDAGGGSRGGGDGPLLNIERVEAGLSRREFVDLGRGLADTLQRDLVRGVRGVTPR